MLKMVNVTKLTLKQELEAKVKKFGKKILGKIFFFFFHFFLFFLSAFRFFFYSLKQRKTSIKHENSSVSEPEKAVKSWQEIGKKTTKILKFSCFSGFFSLFCSFLTSSKPPTIKFWKLNFLKISGKILNFGLLKTCFLVGKVHKEPGFHWKIQFFSKIQLKNIFFLQNELARAQLLHSRPSSWSTYVFFSSFFFLKKNFFIEK